MTISIAWVRRNKDAVELLVASDSRLRSRGALNEAQKVFRLQRGDCCLAFSGDAQIVYPLFMQVGSAIDNYVRTRSRAIDITNMTALVEIILNNLVGSWDLKANEKDEELSTTRILFAGGSWKHKRFEIGFFMYRDGRFTFHHRTAKLPHPWAEKHRSLVFIGDYYRDYLKSLNAVLENLHGNQPKNKNIKKRVDFDYEPVQALQNLLAQNDEENFPAIGGAAQLLKLYSFSNSLPIVLRPVEGQHFLLGRRLLAWEKTEYPILDLTGKQPSLIYPMREIPVPSKIGSGGPLDEIDLPAIEGLTQTGI